jgi:magnesium-dependent phosphatase 1
MNNMNWTAEQSGQNQEDRDRFIAERWGVQTPYVLFSRHHWMPGMPQALGQRFNEMAVYTHIQRSLFEVVPLSDDEVKRVVDPCPFPFHHQFKTWGITVPDATRQEFLKYSELEFYRLSA